MLRFEARDLEGRPIPEVCFDVGSENDCVEYWRLAKSQLEILVRDTSVPAWSCHFLVDDKEVGSWSRAREVADA